MAPSPACPCRPSPGEPRPDPGSARSLTSARDRAGGSLQDPLVTLSSVQPQLPLAFAGWSSSPSCAVSVVTSPRLRAVAHQYHPLPPPREESASARRESALARTLPQSSSCLLLLAGSHLLWVPPLFMAGSGVSRGVHSPGATVVVSPRRAAQPPVGWGREWEG